MKDDTQSEFATLAARPRHFNPAYFVDCKHAATMRDDSFKDYALDQLASLGAVRARSMFGGHGLYHGPEFFGILHQGRLYFRTDARTRPDYIVRGMSPFQPNPRQTLVSYYEVPADVLDDTEILTAWARAALSARPDKRRN
jgi:DNA transformation protein and related proteins